MLKQRRDRQGYTSYGFDLAKCGAVALLQELQNSLNINANNAVEDLDPVTLNRAAPEKLFANRPTLGTKRFIMFCRLVCELIILFL